MNTATLSEIFKEFKDPRMMRVQRYPLINIITIAIGSVIGGAGNFVTMAEFGRSKKELV